MAALSLRLLAALPTNEHGKSGFGNKTAFFDVGTCQNLSSVDIDASKNRKCQQILKIC